ncbi:MAG: DUF3368 domain-containing protein [Crocosphaera sp.]|nr:DUF3368 domain-containing protein [Crocosphaera sp.]
MIIISDTSPLCYLILIDCIELLPILYKNVIIPQAVYQELQAEETPKSVKEWIENYPDWLVIRNITNASDSDLDQLDKGEREAIILAEEIKATLLILDDKIDLPTKVNQLQKTSFFVSPKLLQSILSQHQENL